MDISKRVRRLRKERNMSVYRLSELAALNQSTVQSLENRENADALLSTIEQICNGLGITLAEFFAAENALPARPIIKDLPPTACNELKIFEEFLRYKYLNEPPNTKPGH